MLKSCSPVVLTWCEVHDCVLCRASCSNSVFRLAVNSLAHDNYRLNSDWSDSSTSCWIVLLSLQQKPQRIPLRTKASMRWRSVEFVKPRHVFYVSPGTTMGSVSFCLTFDIHLLLFFSSLCRDAFVANWRLERLTAMPLLRWYSVILQVWFRQITGLLILVTEARLVENNPLKPEVASFMQTFVVLHETCFVRSIFSP